jgi:hypothetical protein
MVQLYMFWCVVWLEAMDPKNWSLVPEREP